MVEEDGRIEEERGRRGVEKRERVEDDGGEGGRRWGRRSKVER